MTAVLYRLTFPNGKAYFGIANDFAKRMRTHQVKAQKKPHCPVHKAIRRFGWENTSSEIVLYGERAYVAEMEIRAIAAFGTSVKAGGGYNCSLGGESPIGPDVRARQADSLRRGGKAREAAYRTWSDPAIRAKRVAYARSPEGREARRGIVGRKLSTETRARMSRANLGKKRSAAHCAAIGTSKRGLILITDEHATRMISPSDVIPSGWRRGRAPRRALSTGAN